MEQQVVITSLLDDDHTRQNKIGLFIIIIVVVGDFPLQFIFYLSRIYRLIKIRTKSYLLIFEFVHNILFPTIDDNM